MPRYINNLRSDIINASSIKAGLESVTEFPINTLIGMKVVKNNIIYEYIGEPIGWVDDNSQYISYDTSNNKLKFELPNQPTDVSVLQIDTSGFISFTPITEFAEGPVGPTGPDNSADISANTVLITANTNNISANTFDIATNTSDISANTFDIATNTSDISANTFDIVTNTSDISTNTTGIATVQSNHNTLYGVVHNTTNGLPYTYALLKTVEANHNALYGQVQNNAYLIWAYHVSDDRIKHGEVYITDPTDSLLKISPQVYYKAENIGDVYDPLTSTFPKQAGVMAQDIWYNTPELRHLVNVGDDADMTKLEDPVNTQTYKDHVANNDIKDDPDYEELGWGTKISTVNYTQFIPYLIQGYKEQQSLITSLQTRIELLEG